MDLGAACPQTSARSLPQTCHSVPPSQRHCSPVMQLVTHGDDADVDAELSATLGYCRPLRPEAPVLRQML